MHPTNHAQHRYISEENSGGKYVHIPRVLPPRIILGITITSLLLWVRSHSLLCLPDNETLESFPPSHSLISASTKSTKYKAQSPLSVDTKDVTYLADDDEWILLYFEVGF